MFTKINAITKKVNQQPNLQLTNYHSTNKQLSHSNPKWDVYSKGKVEGVMEPQDIYIYLNSNKIGKQKLVNKYMKKDDSTYNLLLQDVLNKSLITLKKAI